MSTTKASSPLSQSADSPTLAVYKASAGSGKTFTLAVEYIRLLLINPYDYERILAVTFTNKATEEMKTRILSQLYGLSHQSEDSMSYMRELKKATGMSEAEISKQAGKALHILLHNYHYFRVQTIDTFFQNVLRNLARELQLNVNLRVELNSKEVVEQAVDEIIDSMSDDVKLLRTVMDYVEDNLQDDKRWNIIGNLKEFGGIIFSEVYKQHRKALEKVFEDPQFFVNYKKKLNDISRSLAKKYKEKGDAALQAVEAAGFDIDDFSNKSKGPIGYFLKLQAGSFNDKKIKNASVQKAMDDSEAWVAKSHKRRSEVLQFVSDTLRPMMLDIEAQRPSDARTYNSCRVTLRHINDVSLLRNIEAAAHELNDIAQRFMLSDTQSLLYDIIGDDDTPFIFEKIGAMLHHVMIDEFQDTSIVQWAIFKHLLGECMSHGTSNLVVGDVKQSIYRFRSGDWRLLNGIENEFHHGQVEIIPRRINYRSTRNVIAFNNTILSLIAEREIASIRAYSEERADELKKAYDDLKQEIPEGKPNSGLVYIEMLPKEQLDDMEEKTLQTIFDLMDKGVKQKDIAILVRNKRNIAAIADYIEQNSEGRINIVSDEAFRLDASPSVRIIVNAMKLLAHEDDTLALGQLEGDLHTSLPEAFKEQRQPLLTMSLTDLVEALIQLFFATHSEGDDMAMLNRDGAYVTKFLDKVHQCTADGIILLEDFLQMWDDSLCEQTIEGADNNGVRILTIHKSKGLEFDHVLMPYCNWQYNPVETTIWAAPKEEPFSELPLVPLGYRSVSSLEDTIYAADGIEEYINNIVDNLNLLYVAMTRAKSSLFVFGERDEKSQKRCKAVCEAIRELPATIEGAEVYIDNLDDEKKSLIVTYGTLSLTKSLPQPSQEEDSKEASSSKGKSERGSLLTLKGSSSMVSLRSYPSSAVFRQSNDSLLFASDGETTRTKMISRGIAIHELFSRIRTADDVEGAVRQMEQEEALPDDTTRDELIALIQQKLSLPIVKEWFDKKWHVYNECDIIYPDVYTTQRPDRVITDGTTTIVIDFKTGKPHSGHKDQVRRYEALLKEMSMPGVKGYLWYIENDEIIEVL